MESQVVEGKGFKQGAAEVEELFRNTQSAELDGPLADFQVKRDDSANFRLCC